MFGDWTLNSGEEGKGEKRGISTNKRGKTRDKRKERREGMKREE